jgi:SAM-dependent methyltransferase
MNGQRILQVSARTLDRVVKAISEAGLRSERLIPEYYEFIPLNTHRITAELSFVVDKCFTAPNCSKRFLDVGCGPGNVMLIAETFGFTPFGIEYNPSLVRRAPYRQLKQYSPTGTEGGIYQQDAFKFLHYGDFDVVYLYCPVADHSLEVNLENIIESRLKKGAIYIANLKQDQSIKKKLDFEFLGAEKELPIWRKIK